MFGMSAVVVAVIGLVVLLVLLALLVVTRYKVAGPNESFIITGRKGKGEERNPETGEIFGSSPFMSSLLFIISMLFLAAGLGYGKGSGSLTGSTNVINAITKTFNGLGGLIFLMLLIAQFIAFFNYSNISAIVATKLADQLGNADIGALPLLVGFILLVVVIDMIMPGVIPKWAIIAPIFIPLFYNLDRAADRRRGLPRR